MALFFMILVAILLSLALLYFLSLGGALVAAVFLVRRRLREHQESSPFGF